jgi:hypothetical protein
MKSHPACPLGIRSDQTRFQSSFRACGFTWVELFVVLAGVSFTASRSMHLNASKITDMPNENSLGMSTIYLDSHDEWMPYAKMKTRYTAGSLKLLL